MKIRLSPEVVEKIPGITVSVLVFKDVRNTKKISNVTQLLRGVIAEKKREMKDEEKKKKIQGLLKTGTVETKTFVETQLLKSNIGKITLGRELESGNSLLDLAHFLAMKYLVPVYGRDLDLTEKDLAVEFIVPRQGKKAQDMDYSRETKNAVLWLIDIGSQPKDDFGKLPEEFSKVILKYLGGALEAQYTLNADSLEVDLNFVSQKEIEYKEEQVRLAEERALQEKIKATDEVPFLADGGGEGGAMTAAGDPMLLAGPAEMPLKERLVAAIKEAVDKYLSASNIQLEGAAPSADIDTPNDPAHGDYAANIAMKLGKIAGRPPREIADEIIKLLPKLDYIDSTDIAGPGFINFHLSQSHLQKELEKIITLKGSYGRLAMGQDKKVVIEYSQPNIAKPLGVHHLLSTIIGQILVNLFRYAGYKVTAINYPGDWGTQFGKLLYAYKNWGSEEVVKKDPLNELLKLYVRFHNEAEKDPALDDLGRAEFKKLEEGDEENMKLWRWFKQLSLDEIERIYKILDVKFDEYLGEAMYLEQAKKIIETGLQKGIIEVGEKDALIVKFEDEKYSPFMVRKGDGATLYSTRDLASIEDRLTRYDHPDKIVYVVDVAQSLHFKQLFETAKKFGFVGTEAGTISPGTELVHVVFGRMQLPEGSMSTRKGEVILLDVVIKEAVSRAEKLINEKSPDLSAEERDHVAREMAVSAIKYNIISQNRETNITFDLDRMLSLDGNSGPYLQYAYARAQSIMRKYMKQSAEKTAASAAQKEAAVRETAAKKSSGAKITIGPKNKNQTDLFSLTENLDKEESDTAPTMEAPTGSAPKTADSAPVQSSGAMATDGTTATGSTDATAGTADSTSAASQTAHAKTEDPNTAVYSHETEKRLLRLLPRFPEWVESSVRDYKPNHLSTYLFELARAFSAFYNEVPVLGAAREDLKISRLNLVRGVSTVLKNGLTVLGISVFDRM